MMKRGDDERSRAVELMTGLQAIALCKLSRDRELPSVFSVDKHKVFVSVVITIWTHSEWADSA